jgi:hypothetical protein
MLQLVCRFRSQGMQWPLRAGDTVELRRLGESDPLLSFPAELLIELVLAKFNDLEILDAMKHGTGLRRPLARALTAPTLNEQRRLARRSRRDAPNAPR